MEPDKHDHIGWYALGELPPNVIPYTRRGIELALRAVAFSHHGWDA